MVIGLKDKFFILFHISLSVLFLGSFSTSYAMSKSEAFEYCRDNCGFYNYFPCPTPPASYADYLLGYDEFLDYVDQQNNPYMYVYKNDSSNARFLVNFFDDITMNENGFIGTVNETRYNTGKRNGTNQYYDTQQSRTTNTGSSNKTFPTAANTFYMLYGNGEIIQASFELPITSRFIPDFDYHVTVNNIDDVNCMLRNWSINQWYLGETEDYSTLDAFHMFLYDLNANVELGHVYAYRETNSISGGNALYFQEGNLYANSRYMRHNVLYRLYIEKWLDGVQSNEEYYYIFLPRNAVVSNGQIINYGSGDFNVQDSTNAIIDSQESGDKKIIEALTDSSEVDTILSGEFIANSSGDIKNYAEKFGFTPLDNPFTTFLLHILDETFDALTEPNNVVLQADYKTLHFELNSDDFTTPDSPLKDFIRNLLIFLYIYGNYRFFNHLIVLIQTAKIDKAIATLGTDEFYDSDIM